MRGIVLSVIALAAASIAAPGFAANWELVGDDATGENRISLDRDSVRISGSTRQFWFKRERLSARTFANQTVEMRVFSRVHCAQWTFTPLSVLEYNINGVVTNSENDEARAPGQIPPDSIMEAMAQVVCNTGINQAPKDNQGKSLR